MKKIQQTPEELAIVAAARKHDCLAEVCILKDYHPDFGRVEEYWQPRCFFMDIAREVYGPF